MPHHHPPIPKAPLPTREIFDPFNSSSTGHQIHQHRLSGSISWRESRSYKLAHQLRDTSGRGGSQHRSDLVGAGSVNWRKDGRKENGDWERGAPGLREHGWQDIRNLMSGSRKRKSEVLVDDNDKMTATKRQRQANADNKDGSGTDILPFHAIVESTAKGYSHDHRDCESVDNVESDATVTATAATATAATATAATATAATATVGDCDNTLREQPQQRLPQIFRGLNMYLNGSTAPEVSDYKLKQLFMQHGGNTSIALGRRTVTHVVLGKTCGGGLASGKIHKEVSTVGGKGIKYVTARWILDSVEKGIRQPEGRYMPPQVAGRIGGHAQVSVGTIFSTTAAVVAATPTNITTEEKPYAHKTKRRMSMTKTTICDE